MIKYLTGTEYLNLKPIRDPMSHKGTFGILGLVCGSVSYQGAATFATLSALHTGVGIAVAFIPKDIYIPFASKVSGAVIESLESLYGGISDSSLLPRIMSRKCNALLCGSGLGLTVSAARTVESVAQADLPVVFDGDALTVISRNLSLLNRNKPTIVTPHIGEFSKLVDKSPEYVRTYRETLAGEFAQKYNVYVVLKDFITFIATPDGEVFALDNATSALSKGGSGDVLAGMMASFLAQGMSPLNSAVCAVTLHNGCGKYCEEKYGCYYTQPENIIESIYHLLY